ncbi:hypothetical protein AKJ09_10451 [Labilithrix luteola]|uniref:Peptidase S1 domain-containing protein n=1 Tax=Labilithrix luteola TaxID=1391654 RepID=A0A0K1QDJ3_9BACT|nr:S1 family peptidase [Labilithrix luteola]AKV03788.1 hypothetical protein AKJ09_10451 [Labilithrix luteola]
MARSPVRELVSSALVIALAACAPPNDESEGVEPTSMQRSAILGGTTSSATDDAVIKIYGTGGPRVPTQCTGVLVAPTLILTARHCVTSGLVNNSASQCVLGSETYPIETFVIYVGPTSTQVRSFKVKRVVVDFDSDKCDQDIAGLELTEPVTGVSIPTLELDTLPKVADPVTLVGWGRATDESVTYPEARQRGTGTVVGLGAGTYKNAHGDNLSSDGAYLISSVTACEGDSGSPLFDARGAVLGVTSSGVFPSSETAVGTPCANGMTLTIPFARHTNFVERFFQSIGKMPPRAGRAVPAELGGLCESSNDCNSNFCVGVGAQSMCSKTCAADTDCGGAFVCTDTGSGSSVCLDATTPPSGGTSCAVRSAGGARVTSNASAVLAAVAVLSLARRVGRRRRH